MANIVKTSLGPVGLDKMLVDDIGDVLITNDVSLYSVLFVCIVYMYYAFSILNVDVLHLRIILTINLLLQTATDSIMYISNQQKL